MDATLTHTLLILAAECILVLLAICIVVVVMMLRKSSGDKQAATSMVNKLKKNQPRREETLRGIFASNYNLEGEELDKRVNEFIEREKAFYKMLIATYMQHDGKQFPKLSEALEDVVAPYIELTPKGQIDAGEMDTLKEENSELAAELQANKDIVKELMKEYSAAFEKGMDTDKPIPESIAQHQAVTDTEAEAEAGAETTDGESVDPAVANDELDLDSLFSEEAVASTQAVEERTEGTAMGKGSGASVTETSTGANTAETEVASETAETDRVEAGAEQDIELDIGKPLTEDNTASQDSDDLDTAPENMAGDNNETPAADTPVNRSADTTGDTETPTTEPASAELTDDANGDEAVDIDIDSLLDEAQEAAQSKEDTSPATGEKPAEEGKAQDPALDFDLSEEEKDADAK